MDSHVIINPFAFSIIFLFVSLIMGFIIIIYLLFWKPTPSSPLCQSNTDCSLQQSCDFGICVEINCSSDSDCPNNNICINHYCYSPHCTFGNDCPIGTACLSNTCVPIGSPCSSNSNCHQLSCFNNVCIQCISNSDCPSGQGCFNNSCRYPYIHETSPDMLTFSSPAQENGNISAPPAYFCQSSSCGTGPFLHPISCDSNTSCPSNCQYCVNGSCRCTPGELYEICSSNTDCISGLCSHTSLGSLCVPIGGECAFNYNGSDCDGCCNRINPYCINGKCSNLSLGAICGSPDLPPDMCNNPLSLGAVGNTGISNDGMGFFCVNGSCQSTPGLFNDLCSGNSCTHIHDTSFTCINTISNQMRCLTL